MTTACGDESAPARGWPGVRSDRVPGVAAAAERCHELLDDGDQRTPGDAEGDTGEKRPEVVVLRAADIDGGKADRFVGGQTRPVPPIRGSRGRGGLGLGPVE